ncbi:MAG: NUDIX pyrophosphatase [Thermoplasmatota archaeon]
MANIVSCILENRGKILVLKRSLDVATYGGLWIGVTGYIEDNEDALQTAIKEIKEEVGLHKQDFFFVKRGDVFSFEDNYEGKLYEWIVHPFLFQINDRDKITLNWEHTDFLWVKPSDVSTVNTVPCFAELVKKLVC